ncbi:MAG: pyocin knob domain-containing protein [Lachnospiraceae bacterium]
MIYANKELYDKYGKKITNGLAVYQDAAAGYIDPNTTLDHIILTAHANAPMGAGTLYYIYTVFYQNKYSSSYRAQWAIPYNENGSMYHRYYSGSWSAWRRHVNEDEIPDIKYGRNSVSITAANSRESKTINTGFSTILDTYVVTVQSSVPEQRFIGATATGTNLNVYIYSKPTGTVGFSWLAIGR